MVSQTPSIGMAFRQSQTSVLPSLRIQQLLQPAFEVVRLTRFTMWRQRIFRQCRMCQRPRWKRLELMHFGGSFRWVKHRLTIRKFAKHCAIVSILKQSTTQRLRVLACLIAGIHSICVKSIRGYRPMGLVTTRKRQNNSLLTTVLQVSPCQYSVLRVIRTALLPLR